MNTFTDVLWPEELSVDFMLDDWKGNKVEHGGQDSSFVSDGCLLFKSTSGKDVISTTFLRALSLIRGSVPLGEYPLHSQELASKFWDSAISSYEQCRLVQDSDRTEVIVAETEGGDGFYFPRKRFSALVSLTGATSAALSRAPELTRGFQLLICFRGDSTPVFMLTPTYPKAIMHADDQEMEPAVMHTDDPEREYIERVETQVNSLT